MPEKSTNTSQALAEFSVGSLAQHQIMATELLEETMLYYPIWRRQLEESSVSRKYYLERYLSDTKKHQCQLSHSVSLTPVILIYADDKGALEPDKPVYDARLIYKELFLQIPSPIGVRASGRETVDYRKHVQERLAERKNQCQIEAKTFSIVDKISTLIESYKVVGSDQYVLRCPFTRRVVSAIAPILQPDFIIRFSEIIDRDIEPGAVVTDRELAIIAGFIDIYTQLDFKALGLAIDDVSVHGQNLFYIACKYGLLNQVRTLIRLGADLCSSQRFATGFNAYRSPLNVAASFGHAAVVEYLLANPKIDPNQAIDSGMNKGNNALYSASMYGQSAVIALLVRAGINVNQYSGKNLTPLFIAVLQGHTTAVQMILEQGLPAGLLIDRQQGEHKYHKGITALFAAAKKGDPALVKLLLDNGADPRHQQGEGLSAGQTALDGAREGLREILAQEDISTDKKESLTQRYTQIIEALESAMCPAVSSRMVAK